MRGGCIRLFSNSLQEFLIELKKEEASPMIERLNKSTYWLELLFYRKMAQIGKNISGKKLNSPKAVEQADN